MLPYIEIGADVNADGAVVKVYCIMDGDTHGQIGESLSTFQEADAAIEKIVARGEV